MVGNLYIFFVINRFLPITFLLCKRAGNFQIFSLIIENIEKNHELKFKFYTKIWIKSFTYGKLITNRYNR